LISVLFCCVKSIFHLASPPVSVDYSLYQEFSDDNCEMLISNSVSNNELGCRTILGRYGSVKSICSTEDSTLPLPSNKFVSKV
jgi:hypothetical protein